MPDDQDIFPNHLADQSTLKNALALADSIAIITPL
jgi:hypothetical protein